LSPIDISPVAELYHKNDPHVILKFAKYPKITDPVPPEFTQLATKRFPKIAGILGVFYTRIQKVQNPAASIGFKFAKVFQGPFGYPIIPTHSLPLHP
jgi:hypothetical protein